MGKTCLKLSGIDVAIFTVHSTRYPATSAIFEEGMDFDTIQWTASRSEGSLVFGKFTRERFEEFYQIRQNL